MPMTLRNTDVLFNDGSAQSTSSPKVRAVFDGRFHSGPVDGYGNQTGPGAITTVFNTFNVSSITKNTIGDYTINFASALTDVNYTMAGTCNARSAHPVRGVSLYAGTTPATTSIRVSVGTSGGSGRTGFFEDCERVNVAIFR
jgi:hypothetical protein